MKDLALIKKLNLKPHFENGYYREIVASKNKRLPCGIMLYYVKGNEKTKFHSIDSDEYWIFNQGGPLEIWMIINNKVKIEICSKDHPIVFVPKGYIFASKHKRLDEGTLVTCVTIPSFSKKSYKYYPLSTLKKYKKITKFHLI